MSVGLDHLAETPYQTRSVRQVALVDRQGNVRVWLRVYEDGSPFLRLEAAQGKAMLAVSYDGTPMWVFDRDGQVVAGYREAVFI